TTGRHGARERGTRKGGECSDDITRISSDGSQPAVFSTVNRRSVTRALECVPCLLVRLIEGLARFRQGATQRSPGLTPRLLQLLQTCFGLRRIRLHTFDRQIDARTILGCHFACCAMKLVCRLTPGLHLGGGDVAECGLLLLDLFSESLEIDFDLRF